MDVFEALDLEEEDVLGRIAMLPSWADPNFILLQQLRGIESRRMNAEWTRDHPVLEV